MNTKLNADYFPLEEGLCIEDNILYSPVLFVGAIYEVNEGSKIGMGGSDKPSVYEFAIQFKHGMIVISSNKKGLEEIDQTLEEFKERRKRIIVNIELYKQNVEKYRKYEKY